MAPSAADRPGAFRLVTVTAQGVGGLLGQLKLAGGVFAVAGRAGELLGVGEVGEGDESLAGRQGDGVADDEFFQVGLGRCCRGRRRCRS